MQQDNLSCFIYKMREILDTILDGEEYTFVCILLKSRS